MVKAIWAVACSSILVGIHIGLIGCASVPEKGGGWQVSRRPVSPADNTNSQAPKFQPNARNPAEPGTTARLMEEPNSLYRIGPEDVLHISVWESKELTLDVVVRPDGMISLPLIQDVRADGLTATELAAVIQTKLLAFIKVPQVFVVIQQVNSPKVYILGSVARPGPYPLRGEMSVLQALSLAGGFSQFASPRKIKIVRNNEGKQEIKKVNYYNMIDDGTGNYLLMPGDTIVVP